MFSPAARQTLTVRRTGPSPGDDDYGNPLPGPVVTVDVPNCAIQPLLGVASMENVTADFDQITTRWRFFAPPDADVRADDRVVVDGIELEVDGEPVTWPGAGGVPHHIEGYLKRYEG